MVLGFPLQTIASFLALRGVWAAYIHSNVRLPIGPLRWFLGAPELHHWHHYRDRDVGNYCNLSPLMDILFGTYHCPDHEPERFGIKEPTPRTYWGYMIQALLPRRWWGGISREMNHRDTEAQREKQTKETKDGQQLESAAKHVARIGALST